jgi:hypothetical protein
MTTLINLRHSIGVATLAIASLGWHPIAVGQVAAPDGDRVELTCVQTDAHLIVSRGDAEVLRYNIVAPKAPDEARTKYERSGYIHPLYTPAGRMVSGDFAADHPHQHGLFAAWTSTSYRGKPVDFWNQDKGLGVVLHDRVISVDRQGNAAGFSVGVKHFALEKDGTRFAILDDVWTVSVQAVTNGSKVVRYRVEFSIAQTNITEHPLTVNEYHYGGIGYRGSDDWYSSESAKTLREFVKQPQAEPPPIAVTLHRFLTSNGDDRRKGNHSRPEWASLYGITDDDQTAGVKMIGSPTNLGHPHPVRLHPNKPYFSISPCVLGGFDINPGQTYTAKYFFEVFDGNPETPIGN